MIQLVVLWFGELNVLHRLNVHHLQSDNRTIKGNEWIEGLVAYLMRCVMI